MPNLEYSVRFVLTTDSTKQVDEALQRMRESGSTIEVKLKTDTSGFDSDMAKVKEELKQVEAANEKLSRSAQKGSGLFKMYSKEIRAALNEFRATRNLDKAQQSFSDISARVEQFGKSMEGNAAGMQEFFTLTNQVNSAVAKLNAEQNTSSAVLKSREAAERAVNEEVKRSAQVLATRARASKFEAQQARQATQQVADGVRGTIAELRRLSVQGQATNEQLSRLFLRTAESEEELLLTTEDLSQAFARQTQIVQASNIPYKQKQQLLNQLMMAEEQSAQSIRVANKGLSQQENQVGDVSYAMLSFTRLLEDVPYGFRGFANNIQPTIFGLVQLNDKTSQAAIEFRKLHGKEMPLTQRALINFKEALSSPINQLLLLTSVIAVAGTMMERWSQESNKTKNAAKALGDEFTRLYDVTKGENPFDTDYEQSVSGLNSYLEALKDIVNEEENRIRLAGDTQERIRSSASREFLPDLKRLTQEDAKRLQIATNLSSEAKKKLDSLVAEAELQRFMLQNERTRYELEQQRLRNTVGARSKTAFEALQDARDALAIERTRLAQGEESAALRKRDLALLRLDKKAEAEGISVVNERLLVQAQYELEIFNIRNRKSETNKKIESQYDAILLSLQRQLQDEQKMSDVARLQISRKRELADLEAQIAKRRAEGEEISPDQEAELIKLTNQRFDIMDQRGYESSALIVANLSKQAMLSDELVRAEQELLFGDEAYGIQLDLQIQQMEHQAQLAERLREVKEDTSLTDEARLVAERQITREMNNQFRLSLMRQKADAQATVREFLGGRESEELRIMQNAQQAMLAAENVFYIERMQLRDRFANSAVLQEASMTALVAQQAEKRKAIEKKATDEINAIKVRGYLEGSMMIVGALQQLNESSEATNRAQFERQKRFSASLATINTLLAVTQVLKDDKLGTFMKFAQATAMALTGFAQVRQILGTKYGSASTSAQTGGSVAQGFIESDVQARAGVSGTVTNFQPQIMVNVTGKVDREGIAFAVLEGTDQINSRGVVLQ